MESVGTGVLVKNKEQYFICKDKGEKSYDIIRHTFAYAKIKKNEDLLSIMSNLQPNYCLEVFS